MEHKHERAASEVLEGVVNNAQGDYLSLLEIKTALHERGFGLLMLFFSLPLSLPLPIPPGLTAIPAIPLIMFSIQMIRGMDSPWLPVWVGHKKIKRQTIAALIERAAPYLKKIERLMRPRFSYASSRQGEKVVGVFALVFALSILLPLPLTNFLPAVGITFMALGLMSKDGIFISIGILIGSAGLALTSVVVLLGQKAAMAIIHGIIN